MPSALHTIKIRYGRYQVSKPPSLVLSNYVLLLHHPHFPPPSSAPAAAPARTTSSSCIYRSRRCPGPNIHCNKPKPRPNPPPQTEYINIIYIYYIPIYQTRFTHIRPSQAVDFSNLPSGFLPTMDQLYMPPSTDCCASPLQYATIPDLRSCGYSEALTDPSPSPPMVLLPQLHRLLVTCDADSGHQMFTHLDGFEYNLYANPTDTPHFLDHQPAIVNSIEFMDLTAPQHEDRRRRRSTTAQDKETVSNMRIVGRFRCQATICLWL